ncbi:4-hydroxy-tetrahydrodipicolinate synthase [Melghirimyces profundicolus]|uniref:4-hydroxy-tetrahydrodipicolinate synthase n=1 Tax=Melghirimyces profundicolus TaxID=1242148 RepID=A0A2T6BRF8_9BACL|nr:4-hydroxy-tetrahydrodipicolinate synthase [Melghirimyces profundicolus]PTX58639.1 4-hydroxy-tetrahydrodipicolinate synthase [Melghirimyces profundicolus]
MDVVQFGRLLTAMITPMTHHGAIDWPRVDSVIDHLIQTGTDSIVIAGTTGESPTLSHQEKLDLFRRAVRQADGRVKIIAGTGTNNTDASVQLTREAEETGVDGVMLVVPYYNKPTQEGLYQHFRTVAESTSLPVMLYNIPGRSSVNLGVDTMVRLTHEVENISLIKESSGDLVQVMELVERKREGVAVYSGMDELTVPYLSVGSVGIVSVASHVVGREMKEMIEAFIGGDVERAGRIQRRIVPLWRALFMTSSPAPLKYALSLMGVCEDHVRLPMVPLNQAEKTHMQTILQTMQVIK